MSGLVLHYMSRPRGGVPLVLLPAFPFDGRMWKYVTRELEVDAIKVDPPGFGDSAPVIEARRGLVVAPSLEAYADAVAAALDALDIQKVALAGASMGGYAAMAVAQRFPKRVAGIGLFGTKATPDSAEQVEARIRMAEAAEGEHSQVPRSQLVVLLDRLVSPGTRRDNEELYEKLESWLEQAPAAGIAWAQRAMATRPDRISVLKRLNVPAIVVRGSDDVICTREDHAAMAEALGVPPTEIDRAGHLVAVEAPRRTAFLLQEFHESVNSAT